MTTTLEVQALSYTYPDGTRALANVSFLLKTREKVGLIGPNGAGKSTLLLHLNGLLHVSNAVAVLGKPLSRATLHAVRTQVGMVFQNPDDQLFCPTVFDDVAFGPRNMGLDEAEVARRVATSLAAVGLDGVEHKGPYHLSVGQKKRVALATVLSMEPPLLVLDEPTASLDPRGRNDLIDLLRALGRTQLIATHDLDMVRRLCDRVLVLSAGTIVASGDPAELLSDTALLRAHGLA